MYYTNPSLLDPILHHLANGNTILYPTDTIWGIGCDATNPDAIEKIYQIKQRDHSKSMLILVSDEAMLRLIIPNPAPAALQLLLHSDRPTTVIFPYPSTPTASQLRLPQNLLASDNSIGIRIPAPSLSHCCEDAALCLSILQAYHKPIVSTSANFSGHPSPTSYLEIEEGLKAKIDYCVPNIATQTSTHPDTPQSSQILKLSDDGQIIIIRK